MRKTIITRSLLGFPLGVAISATITILISIGLGQGDYVAVVPQLAGQMGSELGAVVLQYFLSGILGAACAGGSCVWEIADWSLLKQTLVHCVIIAGSMFPIAWFTWWMPHTVAGALLYMTIFAVIYAVLFAIMYVYWRKKVRKMNDCIQQQKQP